MTSTLIFALFLLILSAGLIWSHYKSWRTRLLEGLNERDLTHFRRQYRRRLRTSALIGMLGFAIAASPFLTDPQQSYYHWYWTGLLTLVMVLGMLAIADLQSSHQYARELRRNPGLSRLRPPIPASAREHGLSDQGQENDRNVDGPDRRR